MAELKTKKNDASVQSFIDSVESEQKRDDCYEISQMMEEITGDKPTMWGSSIVGFGSYHYKYASGREADWMLTGFSPRKQNMTIYIMDGFDRQEELMNQLGKFSTGKSCLYFKKLDDINRDVLKKVIKASVDHLKNG